MGRVHGVHGRRARSMACGAWAPWWARVPIETSAARPRRETDGRRDANSVASSVADIADTWLVGSPVSISIKRRPVMRDAETTDAGWPVAGARPRQGRAHKRGNRDEERQPSGLASASVPLPAETTAHASSRSMRGQSRDVTPVAWPVGLTMLRWYVNMLSESEKCLLYQNVSTRTEDVTYTRCQGWRSCELVSVIQASRRIVRDKVTS